MLQKPVRIICWGMGADFKKIWVELEKEVAAGHIHIEAYVDEKILIWNDMDVMSPNDIGVLEYDYVVVCSSLFYHQICKEIINRGIESKKIVNGSLLLENGFDFFEYQKKGWLKNQIINNRFSDVTYEDKKRIFYGKKIELILGRKSYVGDLYFEDGGVHSFFSLNIGNYTSIAKDVKVEIGLNLDHDYHRITNYGISHLEGHENYTEYIIKRKNFLDVGSDVWIGRGCVIKSGIHIGDGAVVASNSYVVKDVPRYAIVGGNPAQVIKYRFDDAIIADLDELQWWEMSETELLKYYKYFDEPGDFIKAMKHKSCK